MLELQAEEFRSIEVIGGERIDLSLLLYQEPIEQSTGLFEFAFLDEVLGLFRELAIVTGRGEARGKISILGGPLVGFLDLLGEFEIFLVQEFIEAGESLRIDALTDDADISFGVGDRRTAPACRLLTNGLSPARSGYERQGYGENHVPQSGASIRRGTRTAPL